MSKILIIDDSTTILALLAAAVRAMKLEPLTAESGEQGLAVFAAEEPERGAARRQHAGDRRLRDGAAHPRGTARGMDADHLPLGERGRPGP